MNQAYRQPVKREKPLTRSQMLQDVQERLIRAGCDPIAGMAECASGTLPCASCDENGLVSIASFVRMMGTSAPKRFEDDPGAMAEEAIECPVCNGTKQEPVSLALRVKVLCELAQYIAPKLKAIEHSMAPAEGIGDLDEERLLVLIEGDKTAIH